MSGELGTGTSETFAREVMHSRFGEISCIPMPQPVTLPIVSKKARQAVSKEPG